MDTPLYIPSWVLLGALAGWIIYAFVPRNARLGILANVVLGIVGSTISGFMMSVMIGNRVTGYGLIDANAAVGGAILLLFIAGFFARPKNKEDTRKQTQESLTASSKVGRTIDKQFPSSTGTNRDIFGIIFISYRRSDSADVAGRIYDRLLERFGRAAIFKDVDSIPLGFDFKEYLDQKVGECNVLLAIIGDRWLEASDSMGRKRLEDPFDFVRIEIESALARGIPVIPLLVRGASMPPEEALPTSLKKLVYRNGIQIRPDPDFHRDMDRLISALKGYIEPEG